MSTSTLESKIHKKCSSKTDLMSDMSDMENFISADKLVSILSVRQLLIWLSHKSIARCKAFLKEAIPFCETDLFKSVTSLRGGADSERQITMTVTLSDACRASLCFICKIRQNKYFQVFSTCDWHRTYGEKNFRIARKLVALSTHNWASNKQEILSKLQQSLGLD